MAFTSPLAAGELLSECGPDGVQFLAGNGGGVGTGPTAGDPGDLGVAGLEIAERGLWKPPGDPGCDEEYLCGVVDIRLGLLLDGTVPD
jgi:hypothetical protein